MDYNGDYKTLIDLSLRLIEEQAGKPIAQGQGWANDSQTLSIKLFRHLVSMQNIFSGVTIEKDSDPVFAWIDHSSIKVIARAALESYLVFYYIYGGGFNDKAEYRHSTWRLAGLVDRQKLDATMEHSRQQLVQEKTQIDDLKVFITSCIEFKSLSKKQQKRILAVCRTDVQLT